jgi:cytochrome b
MKKPVMSIRWFRVVTVLGLAAALLVAAVLLPAGGRLAVGVALLMIVAAAVRLGWAGGRSTTDVIADVDAEPLAARAPVRIRDGAARP